MKKVFILLMIFTLSLFAQEKDKGKLVEQKNKFYEEIVKKLDGDDAEVKARKKFLLELENYNIPESPDVFNSVWHNDPLSQGRSGMCWSFSTTSFLESEANRISGVKVKLSELFTVYYEYIEKAKRFVEERGNSRIAEGSLSGAVLKIWGDYGAVPEAIYDGMGGKACHDHKGLFEEIDKFLTSVKESGNWNLDFVLSTVKSILDHHIGEPPAEFEFEGKKYTPVSFVSDYLKLDPADYEIIISFKDKPYFERVYFDVPDNWWKGDDYINVPLDTYITTIDNALENGYSLCLDADVGESGLNGDYDVGVIPGYDIPSEYVNEDARFYRFDNGMTTDDHLVHMIAKKEIDGEKWYLIKDSMSGAFNGKHPGYFFYNEDYVKLKVLFFVAHKDALKEILAKL
ncbi:MAG: aminopeptidase [Melioribacteraceae bacterium]|nr:MAG: aminopeptidase [Melioribacteraceae bacterium]